MKSQGTSSEANVSRIRITLLASLIAILIAFVPTSTTSAHPLGNFTVNRYARLEVYANVVRVRYVLDMAEIPTFQEMSQIDTDRDGKISDAENARYRAAQFEAIRRNLLLEVNGARAELRALS